MRRNHLVVTVIVLPALAVGIPASAAPGDTILASTSATGVKGDGNSLEASLSVDGDTVAFHSAARNLVPADTDPLDDVYVKDLLTGNISLASITGSGIHGNRASVEPSLSADGNTVSFHSTATNLDPADTDFAEDIYVKDILTGDLTLASTSDAGGKGNSRSQFAALSADGNSVAFESLASNLDPGDSDTAEDIYVKDLITGDITLASTSDSDVKGNSSSHAPSLSADGTKVAFYSVASNLDPADTDSATDIYVKDLITGDITLASTSDAGIKADLSSFSPSLSAQGTYVAFYSHAINLDPADTDMLGDVYVKDLVSMDLKLASTSDAGVKGYGLLPSLSADGTTVAFQSDADTLDPNDTDTFGDIYVKDLITGDITLASTSDAGVKGNTNSYLPSLSADGSGVAFQSFATTLDPADSDEYNDVYVKVLSSPVNDPPVAADDSGTTFSGFPTTIDVVANDFDGNGDSLTVTSVTQPPNGTATIRPNNSVRYRSNCGFQGFDTFSYTISDGNGGTDTGEVTVRVRKTSRRLSIGC
jgi:hypothetical protein